MMHDKRGTPIRPRRRQVIVVAESEFRRPFTQFEAMYGETPEWTGRTWRLRARVDEADLGPLQVDVGPFMFDRVSIEEVRTP